MATGFHEVIGQSIKFASDLNALLLGAKDRDVCHIDEAHELPRQLQTALYLAIDQRKLFVPGPKGNRKRSPLLTSRCCSARPTNTACSSRCGTE